MTQSYLDIDGWIVLYHFDPAFGHAKHCYDWCEDVAERVRKHYDAKTHGPKLVNAAVAAGCKLVVARKWKGTRKQMLIARINGNATRHCQECRST